MSDFDLRGMGVALVTPFTSEGAIDFDTLSRLVAHHVAASTDYLVVLGTTAETPTLHPDERKVVLDFVRKEAAGKLKLVAGVGGNCTYEVTDALHSLPLDGYSAVLSVTPFYNKPSQEGLYRHFTNVAEASPLPVILYNVPGRTGVNMEADTTLRLARDCRNVAAIKEASGNFRQIEQIIEHRPEGFRVLSGDDGITLPLIKLGADGVISVLGNAFPARFQQMVHLALEGKWDEAGVINDEMADLYRLLFVDGNPAGIKAALAVLGLCQNELRLPLTPVKPATYEALKSCIQGL